MWLLLLNSISGLFVFSCSMCVMCLVVCVGRVSELLMVSGGWLMWMWMVCMVGMLGCEMLRIVECVCVMFCVFIVVVCV